MSTDQRPEEPVVRRRLPPEYVEYPPEMLDEPPVSLLHYVNVLLRRRWLIILGTMGLVVLVGAYTKLAMTPVFTAQVKFLPSGASEMAARMSSIVGGGVPAGIPDDTTSVDYYTALSQSPLFLERLIKKPFAIQKLGGSKPLLEYFEIAEPNETIRLQKGIEALAKIIKVTAGRPTAGRVTPPIVTVSVETSEPQLSADLANAFLAEVLEYNQSVRNAKAIRNREFVERQLADNQKLLKQAEDELADFTARNRKLATPDLEAEKDRLARAVKVQEEVFITLKKQLELARIEEQENQPSLEIIERAVAPLRKSSPSTVKNAALAGVLGLMLFAGLAFVLNAFQQLDPNDEATREFLATLKDMKGDFVKVGKAFEIEDGKKKTEDRRQKTEDGKAAPPSPTAP